MNVFAKVTLLGACFGMAGCVTWFSNLLSSSYDSRPLVVETLSLFNQRLTSTLASKSWKGDWLFRRERLALVDEELRSTKPDILIFQQMMAKSGSASESDRNILARGALDGYAWSAEKVRDYSDTHEDEFHAVAVGIPVTVRERDDGSADAPVRGWAVGPDGFMSLAVLMHEDQPIYLFNVEMPSAQRSSQLWYRFVEERIEAFFAEEGEACRNRLIVAGALPAEPGMTPPLPILDRLSLKDVSQGACEVASDCFTATPMNEIFMATGGNDSPSQLDRILVHRSALVNSSMPSFRRSNEASRYTALYGLQNLWPSLRLGWRANIRLPRCHKSS